MKTMYSFIVLLTAFGTLQGCQKKEAFPEDAGVDKSKYEYVADWQEGYLDIHQISTGLWHGLSCRMERRCWWIWAIWEPTSTPRRS